MRQRTPLEPFATRLRKNATDAETWLWSRLLNRQLDGHKFRRQMPVGSYIVDFICIDKKLVVELDGGQHQLRESQEAERTAYLQMKGLMVLRFWND